MSRWYYDTFASYLLSIEQGLRSYIRRFPKTTPLLWTMVDYHFGWTEEGERDGLLNLSGKRVRPLLTLLAAEAVSGGCGHALPGALAIEIVHNFTLVHDDVMDRSDERRHRPTLWAKWGTAQAINAGDGLFALGMSAILDLTREAVAPEKAMEALALLMNACLATVEGQMLDVGFEDEMQVEPDEYLKMVALKSGALIEASAKMGALLSTDDRRLVNAYGEFGLNLGIAFQIWDDYLGIWGEARTMGKSATSDIEGKKKSYPVLTAFQRADDAMRRELASVYRKDVIQPADVSTVVGILDTVDAASLTKEMIETYFRRALDALDSTKLDNEPQRRLRELAAFLVSRSY